MDIGKMTVSNGIKYLQPIADSYGLNLKHVTELKFARLLFVNIYRNKLG